MSLETRLETQNLIRKGPRKNVRIQMPTFSEEPHKEQLSSLNDFSESEYLFRDEIGVGKQVLGLLPLGRQVSRLKV